MVLVFWSLVRNNVVLAVYLLFSVACFFTVHEHYLPVYYKAQINVAETKAKYDKAVDELEKLLTKRQERDNKQLLEAFSESGKTLAEVIEFLQGNTSLED